MTQNIYDDPNFFCAYGQLPRSLQGLDAAPEFPALRALLPNLGGSDVLDLGCGYGWFCRWARSQGAGRVTGVDVSERMLARAHAMTNDPAIAYTREDLETIKLQPKAYGLVYSSLAFHYLDNLERLLGQVRSALAPGGRLVFSVEHPMVTAPRQPGWIDDASGRSCWPVSDYLREGERSTDWLAKGVIKQHRTIATYVGLLLRQGLQLTHLEEWGPTPQQVAAQPALAIERERPPFLLLAAD
ncbi:MAG TPA: class I SAM-dependent methyltransferase [Hyphomicrobiaceae bacterium]|jgi:SAM-dependent methyltransferase|nr:class I SAM-dependent methyltransferase [Hyphomicrobiaceae bacterium]